MTVVMTLLQLIATTETIAHIVLMKSITMLSISVVIQPTRDIAVIRLIALLTLGMGIIIASLLLLFVHLIIQKMLPMLTTTVVILKSKDIALIHLIALLMLEAHLITALTT